MSHTLLLVSFVIAATAVASSFSDAHVLAPQELWKPTTRSTIFLDQWRQHLAFEDKFTQQQQQEQQKKKQKTDLCPECEAIFAQLVKIANSPADVSKVETYLEGRCMTWFPKNTTVDRLLQDLCKSAIDFLVKKAVGGITDGEHNKWNDPKVFCSWIEVCRQDCCLTQTTPEQVHLTFADNKLGFKKLRVSWVTLNAVSGAQAQWWTTPNNGVVPSSPATVSTYTAGGWNGKIYTAELSNLPLNSTFVYRVGADNMWSPQNFTVRTPPADAGMPGGRPTRFVQLGDMGERSNSNDTIARVTALAQAGKIDFFHHTGDIAYANGDQLRWDEFMRKIQPYAAILPGLYVQGNHECGFNFAAYRARLSDMQPKPTPFISIKPDLFYWDQGFFNINVGGISFVMLNVEAPFGGIGMTKNSQEWAAAAMANAAKERDAGQAGWIIAAHHRPLYCTNGGRDCGKQAKMVRGWVEQAYIKNKLDVHFSGHMHDYERCLPVANGSPVGPNSTKLTSPGAPVYLVQGASGCQEGLSTPKGGTPWSAFISRTFGYGVMSVGVDTTATNNKTTTTTLQWEFHQSSNDVVLDSLTITKNWGS